MWVSPWLGVYIMQMPGMRGVQMSYWPEVRINGYMREPTHIKNTTSKEGYHHTVSRQVASAGPQGSPSHAQAAVNTRAEMAAFGVVP